MAAECILLRYRRYKVIPIPVIISIHVQVHNCNAMFFRLISILYIRDQILNTFFQITSISLPKLIFAWFGWFIILTKEIDMKYYKGLYNVLIYIFICVFTNNQGAALIFANE